MELGAEALAAIGGLVITIITFVWRTAMMAARIQRVEDTARLAHERIDKYSGKSENSIEELRQQILTVIQVQTRIEEKVSFLIEARAKNH